MPRAGRKELFHEDMIRQAEVLGSFNFDLAQLAQVFGVEPSTISRYNKKHPELKQAFVNGRAKFKAKIGSKFIGEVEKGNWDAIKHGLKHVVGWKDDAIIDASQHTHITVVLSQEDAERQEILSQRPAVEVL